MTFGGGNLRGQNIPVAWQNRSQLTPENSGHSNSQLFLICWIPLFYERWTRPTVFRLRAPPPIVISHYHVQLHSAKANREGTCCKLTEHRQWETVFVQLLKTERLWILELRKKKNGSSFVMKETLWATKAKVWNVRFVQSTRNLLVGIKERSGATMKEKFWCL
jgi:hypothetical protein